MSAPTELRAFHNDPEIQAKYLARVEAHYLADEIIQGVYWDNGKGCAVGCTIHSDEHGRYETELGIPRVVAKLEDRIFEGLNNGHAKEFPRAFLRAVPLGADLSLVWPRFAVWLMTDPEYGVRRHVRNGSKQAEAVELVAGLFARQVSGDTPTRAEFKYAADTADAGYAAVPDAGYAYAVAAVAAADVAAAVAAAAAAADAAACRMAKSTFWQAAAAKLIELVANPAVEQEHA